MAKKNRKTLKEYFQEGRLPSQEHFSDLIDSTLNVIDEGFDKSPEEGFKVSQLGDSGKLISFFENIAVKSPLWSLALDPVTENLVFEGKPRNSGAGSQGAGGNDSTDVLSLSPDGRVGVNKRAPGFELDVEGTVSSLGRIGGNAGYVPADGKWHEITEELEGCHALEIMAGVGERGSGKYALIHAFAVKAFGARGKITYHQAHYGSRCNCIKLGWKGKARTYRLQLRTRCKYKEGIHVKYYITRLWFDPYMNDNRPPEGGPANG